MDERIKKVLDFSLSNLDEKITLDDACRISNLSHSRFCDLFKKETNLSFNKFMRKIRIEKACLLLKNESFSIKEISYDVGYHDHSNFDHDFKNKIGVSPSEYRQNIKKQRGFLQFQTKLWVFHKKSENSPKELEDSP